MKEKEGEKQTIEGGLFWYRKRYCLKDGIALKGAQRSIAERMTQDKGRMKMCDRKQRRGGRKKKRGESGQTESRSS